MRNAHIPNESAWDWVSPIFTQIPANAPERQQTTAETPGFPDSWLQPDSALAVVGIWGVRKQIEGLSLYFSLSL